MAHLRAVPDPDDDPVVEPAAEASPELSPESSRGVHRASGPASDGDTELDADVFDPAAAVAPGEDLGPAYDVEPGPDPEEPRRYPSTIGGAFYLSILAVSAVALVIASRGDWRLGVEILGGALLVAAFLRLVLAGRDAGMLAVRHRLVDVFLLAATGVALIALATTIPDMPVA